MKSSLKYPSFLAVCLLVIGPSYCTLSCRDNNNNPVGWFIVYKMPQKHTAAKTNDDFPPHLYMDANTPQFTESRTTLNSTQQSVAHTLQQVYSNHKSTDFGYILYNDQTPEGAGGGHSEYLGHTKGVVFFDKNSGIWLVHSVPRFPPPTNLTYSYPDNAVKYGQHFLCLNLHNATDVTNAGKQILMNEPFLYDWNLPASLLEQYPVMAKVIQRVKPKTTSSIIILNPGVHSTHFVSFAKSRKFNRDLYTDLVATSLKCSMYVGTWRRGHELDSNCDHQYKVYNVEKVYSSAFDMTFPWTSDHSKYAVCTAASSSSCYVCIGDINRQAHQMVRGGGTVCMSNCGIDMQYLKFINKTESCPPN